MDGSGDRSGRRRPAGIGGVEDRRLVTPTGPPAPVDHERLVRAMSVANLPTLTMVLHQLTGEDRWLQEPFLPTPSRGLAPHDSGGFPDGVAGEIRAAAVAAVSAWAAGRPPAMPHPAPEHLRRMLSLCVGDAVPDEYERLMREEILASEHEPALEHAIAGAKTDPAARPSVVIIGAGLSGLLAGVQLRAAGLPFTILERNAEVGGVWLTNTYPGAGVDTPSYLYSLSFFPRKWTTHFAKRDEVAAYTVEVADHFGLRPHIRLRTTVEALVYDEQRQEWTVRATGPDGRPIELVTDTVISAVGLFNTPKDPQLQGIEDFAGTTFHSAEWPADLDLSGRSVAVVGAGASAMQVVPAIAEDVGRMTVFQRSAQWIAPNSEYFEEIEEDVGWLMERVPYYHAWYRFRLAWIFNDRVHASLQIDPEWTDSDRSLNAVNDGHRRYFTRYITEQLEGREDLLSKSVPGYPPFGKRMLLDNGWYEAIRRPGVELVTDRVERVVEDGVIDAAGRHHEADVLILCTGFTAHHYLPSLEVVGRGGRTLRDVWGEDDATAHLGITVPGFPNLFLMYGPNTNAGAGGSVIFVAECQARYILQLLNTMRSAGLGALDCRPEALERWVTAVDDAHAGMVWSHPGMSTYYRNSRGRVVTNSPWRIIDYWQMTQRPDLQDFVAEARREGERTPDPKPGGRREQLAFRPDGMYGRVDD